MVEGGRDLWILSGPTPLLRQGHPEHAQDHAQTAVEDLQGDIQGDPTTFLGNLFSVFITCTAFPDVQKEPPMFRFLSSASCPVTGHH